MTRKHGPHRLQKPSSTCSQWTLIFQRLPFLLLFLPSLTAHFPARISADHLLNKPPVRESLSQGLFLGESKAILHFSPLPILVPSTCPVSVGVKEKKKNLAEDLKSVKMLRRVYAFPSMHLPGSIMFISPKHVTCLKESHMSRTLNSNYKILEGRMMHTGNC